MSEIKNYLSQNIKILRKTFGESQLQLAFALGLDAPTAISNYENGTRSPKPEVRKKIADHFRITEEQLMYVDLSAMSIISFEALNDIHKLGKMIFKVFPVVCSEAAMKNASFANGYNAHMRIKECIVSGQKPDYNDYDICYESYNNAFAEDEIPEAAANMIWWLLQVECFVLNQQLSEGVLRLMKNKISIAEFIRQCCLKNFDFENEEDGNDIFNYKESLEVYNDIEEIVPDLLSKIKSSHFSDLAYYYTAIRYAYGIVGNELSMEMNKAIGSEMLWAISDLGNKYAKNFLKVMISLI